VRRGPAQPAQNKAAQNKAAQNKAAQNKAAQNKAAQNKAAQNKAPTRSAPVVRTTAARPRPASPPQPRVRARRGFHLTFWIFSAAVISLIVVGIVALNAMVVNTTYRIESGQQTLGDLQTQQKALSTEVARLSSPSRIAEWAATQQMVMPDDVVILRVAGVGVHP
jgi:cell division protein FtsL